jgi:protein arginine kinase activator
MLCEICKKNQATFYRLVPALGKQAPVCVACMSKLSTAGGKSGMSGFTALSGFDMIEKTLMEFQPVFTDFYSGGAKAVKANVVCSNCGFEFDDYFEGGRFGCSKCYDVFKDKIVPMVQQIHGSVRHNGSRPQGGRG